MDLDLSDLAARLCFRQRMFAFDWRLDDDSLAKWRLNAREIRLAQLARCKELRQSCGCLARSREDDHTARSGVETMHEKDRSELRAQQLFERPLFAIACRLRRHSCGLVDGNEVVGDLQSLELRNFIDDRDAIGLRDFTRCNRDRPFVDEDAPLRNQLPRPTA